MSVREFDTGFWGNPSIRKLPPLGKLLAAYVFTNDHCSPAGLYEIAPETIEFDTGIPQDQLDDLFKLLEPNIKWYPDKNLIWIRNFIRRQMKSVTFLQAVAKYLVLLNHDDIIQELLAYNRERHNIIIPFELYKDKFRRLSEASAEFAGEKEPRKSSKIADGILDPKLAAIAKSYEDNIAMLTPAVVPRLEEISDTYPDGWFQEAVKEAVEYNHRNLRYIETILKRWKEEGKGGKRQKSVEVEVEE